ncbi:dihydroxyacetone kinase subunit DhaK [Absicoccus porci]|uniref:dihydroxyacetone kinase subunit DhaK n=1 Tax=Absicoccus porci TaxID=2486576 RepID=UPI003D8A45E6
MNSESQYFQDVMQGVEHLYQNSMRFLDDQYHISVRLQVPHQPRVSIIGICDGGHLPLFAEYVGKEELDGSVQGDVFTAPSIVDIRSLIQEVDQGKGVIVFNFHWDDPYMKNIDQAINSSSANKVYKVVIQDDCMQQPWNDFTIRLSGCGLIWAMKIAYTAAKKGMDIIEILTLLTNVQKNMRSASVCANSFYVNQSHPYLRVDENKMQIGIGIHGEPGFEMVAFPKAETIAEHLFRHRLNQELNLHKGDRVALMINNLGTCSREELMIIFSEEYKQLCQKDINVVISQVGTFVSSLDLNGVAIAILKLNHTTENLLKE